MKHIVGLFYMCVTSMSLKYWKQNKDWTLFFNLQMKQIDIHSDNIFSPNHQQAINSWPNPNMRWVPFQFSNS